jgi:sulfate adenylyltransferase subunit 1 (EFTu-like GTPase family)
LLQLLESIPVHVSDAGESFTFPVQGRVGRNGNTRYTGRISSGVLRLGTKVRVYPSGEETTVEAIELYQELKQEALPGESVSLRLAGTALFNRGHLLADAEAKIRYTRKVSVDACWFSETPLQKDRSYILAHVTGETRAVVDQVEDKIDFTNLERLKGEQTIGVNDIATFSLQLEKEIPAIAYRENRTLGSIILIDPDTHQTVATGMIINRK